MNIFHVLLGGGLAAMFRFYRDDNLFGHTMTLFGALAAAAGACSLVLL